VISSTSAAGASAPRRARTSCAAARAQERLERHLDQPEALPQRRERLAHLGAGEAEHQERPPRQQAERRVDELHGGVVAPVQIVEHEQDRPARGLRGEPVPGRASQLIARERGVAARRVQGRARRGGEGDAGELAEELGDAPVRDARGQLATAGLQIVLGADPRGAADRGRQRGEGRTRADRVGAADQDLGGVGARLEARDQLAEQPRLAHARRRDDEDGAGHRLGRALVVDRLEQREHARPSDEADLVGGGAARGRDARLDQARRDPVHAHARAFEQRCGPIGDLTERRAAQLAHAGRDRDPRLRRRRGQRLRGRDRALGLIDGVGAHEGGEERPVGE
jgi:hypothetical protein